MNALLVLLAQNALLLAAGTTLLLSLGCGAVWLCKSPVHRQRISEFTLAGVLGWIVLALFPLPRLLPENYFGQFAKPQAAAPEPIAALESTDPPAAIIHGADPILFPSTPQWVLEDASIYETDSLPLEGRPFRADPDGPEGPSYIASPSEELSGQSATSATPTLATWKFDPTKFIGLFTGAYLAGASLCLLLMLAGSMLLLRIRWGAEAPPHWLAKQYRALAHRAGITPPQLIVSSLCARPLTWGVLWPVVVLPRSLCRQENKSQLETILLHELEHIAQRDSQGNLLFCVALPLLYAHPLYWWLRRESQLAAELVADDWAAWQTGKETYVEELVALARCTGTSSLPLVGVTGLFSSPSQFYRRMHMLLAREKPLSTKPSLAWRLATFSAFAGSVAIAASLAGVRPAVGQAPPDAAPPTTTPAAAEPATTPALPAPVPVPPIPSAADPAAPLPTPPLSLPATFTPPVAAPPGATAAVVAGDDPAEAELLAEIQVLQAKLQELEGKRRSVKRLPSAKVTTTHDSGKKIAIARGEGGGKIWAEIWTTDTKGQPGKVLSKTVVEGDPSKPAQLAFSPDGKVLFTEVTVKDGSQRYYILDAATGKILGAAPTTAQGQLNPAELKRPQWRIAEVVERDGVHKRFVLDGATGKVIEAVPPPAKGTSATEPKATPPAADPNTTQKPAASTLRSKELRFPTPIMPSVPATPPVYGVRSLTAQPAGVLGIARDAQQLDLVSLAISYADAVGVLEAAQAKVEEHGKLSDKNVISQQEVTAAKLALSAAQRKEKLLRSIAEVTMHSAAEEYERTAQLHKAGQTTASAATEAKTRMEILKQILGTRSADSEPKK